ncbi:MAG: hypothetical protein NC253_09655 [Ruminococcus sp.]|nr:hypothetical protein [Ruminococcus sp.]MCM1382070.1 hypothetical protein [Muribaculaceae bacterium]MCM1480667.1 hypothetical protein [Muribaculaceae bacterium]
MADGKYSIDDILNEYSGNSKSEKKKVSDIDIDNILNNYGAESVSSPTYERDGDLRTENEPVLENPVNSEIPAGAEDDGFAKKYGKLSQALNSVHEKKPLENYTPEPKPDRSFSEKMEQSDIYGDEEREREEEDNKGLFKREPRRKTEPKEPVRAAVSPPEPPIQSAAADVKKPADDPFEKYPASEEKNLDDILSEYSEKKKKSAKSESTLHRGITDLFTRLIPKQDGEGVTGNTELLDGMMKAKRERLSRTQHVAPIERTSILDIDLNLEDKILQDTSQIPTDTEQHELDKISALKERRSKKIKDFILVGDEEDVSGEEVENNEAQKVIDDFESFDDAASIAHDIAQLKGSLILRLVVLIICFAASAYIAVANDTQGLPIMELLNKRTQTSTYLFVNAILGLLAAFSSYTVISCGLSKILSLKADCDSLCAVSTVTSIVTSMIMFANANLIKGSFVHIYVPVAIASLLFNTIGKLLIVSRTQRSFRFVSGGSEKYAVFPVADEETAQNFTRGTLRDFPNLAAMRKTEFLSEFLKTSYANDSTDSFCRIFTPAVIAVAIVIAVVAGIISSPNHGSSSAIYIGISVFVGVISICTGFSMMLVVNVPMMRAAIKGAENQGVVLGYDCIEEFSETNSVLADANQLFPQGSVKLAAIKVFSDTRIDEAIVEAASLTTQAGSILKNMFYDIIAGKTELLNPVESYIFEDSMGLCGWINNKRVLLGNRELMVNHSIEGMPPVTKEKEYTENGRTAVYLSISGELSAMFLVEITPTLEVAQALQDLQKNDVYIMIRSVDSIVSINRLSELFEISPEYLKLIPFRVHEQFNEVTSYQVNQRATLACSGKFSAFASLVLSCKHMKGTINVGIGLQAVSMLLGIIICLVMVILNSFQELSVSMFLAYNFIFTAVLVFFQLLRKN